MLTREETTTITEHLAAHLGPTGDIRTLIRTVYAPDEKAILLALPTNITSIGDQSRWLVQYCLACWWPPDLAKASLLELLLIRLVNMGGIGQLAPLRDRVHTRTDPNAGVFEARWVTAEQPFFDRAGTRSAIQQLITSPMRPILRINGPGCSGKSYTLELVAHLSFEGPAHVRFTQASVDPNNAPSFTVEELAQTLTVPMGVDEPLPSRSSSSYAKTLCLWIIRNAIRRDGLWVLVLDGFGNENVSLEVRQLVEALSAQVLAPEIAKRVRLMLIDYDHPLPGHLGAKLIDDKLLDPMTIGETDVYECLVAYNERRRQLGHSTKVIDPAQVGSLAASLLMRAPASPAERLRGLYNELRSLWQL
jgi:hypothetical protein